MNRLSQRLFNHIAWVISGIAISSWIGLPDLSRWFSWGLSLLGQGLTTAGQGASTLSEMIVYEDQATANSAEIAQIAQGAAVKRSMNLQDGGVGVIYDTSRYAGSDLTLTADQVDPSVLIDSGVIPVDAGGSIPLIDDGLTIC